MHTHTHTHTTYRVVREAIRRITLTARHLRKLIAQSCRDNYYDKMSVLVDGYIIANTVN